jgi:hypothetical protein
MQFFAFFSSAVTKTTRRNYGKHNIRQPTMNDMPVPEGDFMAMHKKRQARHHAILAAGAVSLGFALTLVSNEKKSSLHPKLILKLFFSFSVSSNRHRQVPLLSTSHLRINQLFRMTHKCVAQI